MGNDLISFLRTAFLANIFFRGSSADSMFISRVAEPMLNNNSFYESLMKIHSSPARILTDNFFIALQSCS